MNIALIGVDIETKRAETLRMIEHCLRSLQTQYKQDLHLLLPDNEFGHLVMKILRDYSISHQMVERDSWMRNNSSATIALNIRTKIVQMCDVLVALQPTRHGSRQYIDCAIGHNKKIWRIL